jgi:hypothetical protein
MLLLGWSKDLTANEAEASVTQSHRRPIDCGWVPDGVGVRVRIRDRDRVRVRVRVRGLWLGAWWCGG